MQKRCSLCVQTKKSKADFSWDSGALHHKYEHLCNGKNKSGCYHSICNKPLG